MIDFNLKSVRRLQRVVIVDACEAEAIFDTSPAVERSASTLSGTLARPRPAPRTSWRPAAASARPSRLGWSTAC